MLHLYFRIQEYGVVVSDLCTHFKVKGHYVGVMVSVLEFDIVISEFEPHLCNYINVLHRFSLTMR